RLNAEVTLQNYFMRKIISFMHISLDGFVAGPQGEMNWIKMNQEIFDHVGKRIKKDDSAIYGRNTFQLMEDYWHEAGSKPNASNHEIEHSKWYKSIQKVVLSRTLDQNSFTNMRVISENIRENIQDITRDPGEEILVFGSPTATHELMRLNLIDGFWL